MMVANGDGREIIKIPLSYVSVPGLGRLLNQNSAYPKKAISNTVVRLATYFVKLLCA